MKSRRRYYRILLISLLLVNSFFTLYAGTQLSGITISRKDAPLSEIFVTVYQQSGFYFLYQDEVLKGAKKVTIDVKDATIEEVLEICFAGQPLTFTISEHHVIVVSRKAGTVPESEVTVWAEGKIVNEKDQPLEGANIQVKGTFKGTQSDARGNFKLKLKRDNLNLEISYTGYQSKQISAIPGQFMTISLSVSASPLDQIQVIAYGSVSKRLNIGDVASVNAKTIAEQPVSNALEALEGRVAGLQITQQTGVPGGAITVLLRGQNSIANGNNPLYIVDGVPFTGSSLSSTVLSGLITNGGNPMSTINPANIESIEILKDADATSIYGSRGANGVILITTKMGKAGRTAVDLNVYAGAGRVTRMMPLLNTPQYLEMRHEAFNNDGQTPSPYVDYDLLSWDTTRYTDWQKTLYGETSAITNAEISVSGGNQNTQFILGGGYNRQTTVFPGTFSYERGSGHVGINHSSSDQRLKINFSTMYAAENNFLPHFDNTTYALSLPPDAPHLYDSAGKLNWENGSFTNPYAIFLSPYSARTNNLISNIVLCYEFLPRLSLKINGGYSNMQMNETQTNPLISFNPAYGLTSGFSYFSNQSLETWILEPQIEYRLNSGIGNFNILVGSTFQQSLNNGQTLFANGFASDVLIGDLGAASSINQINTIDSKYRYMAVFGRVNYNWKDKYLFSLTARRDGSSRFGPDNQFAGFGSVAAGWIFSKENFFQKNVKVLSFGKLRSSYGSSGNDQIGDYQYLDSWSPVYYNYQSTAGIQPARLFNPNYGWEVNKKWEAGLELGFLKDRIYFTSSYYQNRSSSQLVGYPLPLITGFSSVQQNLAATVQNTGWEFVLTTRNTSGSHFLWTTSFNLTVPANKLLSYPNIDNSSYQYIYTVGRSLNTFKSFEYTGVDPKTGLYGFKDVNKDGVISLPSDLTPTKTVAQQYYGGLSNTLQYGNWQLTVFFQFVKQIGRNYIYANYTAPGMFGNQPTEVLDHWQKTGDRSRVEQYTQSYGSEAYAMYNNLTYSDQAVSDASYIRLKNISVSYQLSKKMLANWHMQGLRMYIQGQNLLTITHFQGVDPENQSLNSLPPLKVLTAGIQVTL